jgi:hypothetical protein
MKQFEDDEDQRRYQQAYPPQNFLNRRVPHEFSFSTSALLIDLICCDSLRARRCGPAARRGPKSGV